MEQQAYMRKVKNSFQGAAEIQMDTPARLVTYEEVFRWLWIATKLKITSFVQYTPHIDGETIRRYSADCLQQALMQKRGLPRGFQNGIVSFSVLASEQVTPDAAMFASARPQKHYSAFEYPVVVDLQSETVHYYRDKIVWGALYDGFMKDYLLHHFSVQ